MEKNPDETLSELELDELFITKFVPSPVAPPTFEDDETSSEFTEVVETARAVASPIEHRASPVLQMRKMDEFVVLDEHECIHRPSEDVDGASALMRRIQNASEDELKTPVFWDYFEKSRKWKKTSRTTELALINSIISNVDARPSHLHVFFRRLTELDVIDIVRNALLNPSPSTKFRSLFRLTIKTEMPLRQFLTQLDAFGNVCQGMEMTEGLVTGIQKTSEGGTRKFLTGEIGRMAELEHILMDGSLHQMVGSVRLRFEVTGREHVQLGVDYHNELDAFGRRFKTIVIEQVVTPPKGSTVNGRRVTFGPEELNEIVVFEIQENAPFHPLRYSQKIFNLIEHLENSVENASFKYVTQRG